ncbi:MAG TPA: hypothetical protein VGD62_05570 [Acidobacteriaceae bacterium]
MLALLALPCGMAPAQVLEHRAAPFPAPAARAGTPAVRKLLPAVAEGEYRWREPGEVIELYVEDGFLRGYLTRRSERGDPASTPLTFSFVPEGTGASGDLLRFTTQRIHGEWYSFEGRVERGEALSSRQEGYYLLTGTLRLRSAHGEQASQVRLKLAAARAR